MKTIGISDMARGNIRRVRYSGGYNGIGYSGGHRHSGVLRRDPDKSRDAVLEDWRRQKEREREELVARWRQLSGART